MESNGNSRAGLLRAGGVLTIIAGVLQIVSVVSLVLYILSPDRLFSILDTMSPLRFVPFIASYLLQFIQYGDLEGLGPVLFAVGAGVLAIVAIVGGISAIRRKSFGLSLAGAICCLPSSGLFSILAIIFVVLGRREFGTRGEQSGLQG
jgi:hypothetical protein